MILAIVGTRRFGNPKGFIYAELLIREEVQSLDWHGFVTGDAEGVDKLTALICSKFSRDCIALSPIHKRWEPEGYKARNTLVAETCDELLCIRDPGSSTYGSGWTADYAESLGKPVTRVTIS